MQRIALLGAWLALAHAFAGVSPADAQANPGSGSMAREADTIPITLAHARELALTRNPAFLADRQALPAARGGLRQASALAPNPEIDFQSRGAPDLESGAFEATATQELELAGQRFARVRAARSGVRRAEGEVANAARRTLLEVSEAFFEAAAARERLEVARELFGLNEQLVRATRIQLNEGEISRLEANLVEIEVGRARARVLTESRAWRAAVAELERQTGTPGVVPVRPDSADPLVALPPQELDSLLASALARRPDLAAAEAASAQAQAFESLARREAFPNVRVGAVVERDESSVRGGAAASPRVGLFVGTAVPFWNRNQGAVAEREAIAEEMELRREAAELAVRTEVVSAYQAYRAAVEEAEVFATQVLEPARASQALLETAFVSGKIDLPTLLLLRNQLLEGQFGYWDAWLAERRARAALEAATGEALVRPTANDEGDR